MNMEGYLQQNRAKAKEFYARSADLGFSTAHGQLSYLYHDENDLKNAKFHFRPRLWQGTNQQGTPLVV
jgi:TPR repeat protein